MGKIKIGNRYIGQGCPVYMIAEMSANHAGSIERAKEIIHAAKESGADCVKIQTYTPDTLTIDCSNRYFQVQNGTWEGENLYSLYGKAYTPWEWQGALKEEADRVGIDFLSTPFDTTSVDFLEELGLEFYKIASFEMVDLPLVEYVASKGKPVIMSTGMATLEEIEEAVETVYKTGNRRLVLLRCSSVYPADPALMNLRTIQDMRDRFHIPVGLSDHSMGSLSAVASVALGAAVIEKHFCISREIENPDASFSMTPEEYKAMVRDVRAAEAALGRVFYGVGSQEESSVVFRRSIFAVQDIGAGEVFTRENIRIIRPGYGLMPREYGGILGKACLREIKRGEPVLADNVKGYMELVPAGEEHRRLVFGWANDPETRSQSFAEGEISWETHCAWYEDSLKREDRKIYICMHNEAPVGIYRLDLSGEAAQISYSIAPEYRRRGYGQEMLRAGEALAGEIFPQAKRLCARVKPGNEASRALFGRLGYEERTEAGSMVYEKNLTAVLQET